MDAGQEQVLLRNLIEISVTQRDNTEILESILDALYIKMDKAERDECELFRERRRRKQRA